MSENADNIEAINVYFHTTPAVTAGARVALNEWVKWYEETKPGVFSFWSDADVDHARNLRNSFNRMNAVTTAEKAKVEEVIQTGQSLEQSAGETDRRNAEGNIEEQPPGITHAWWFWPAVAAGATAVVITAGPALVKLYAGVKTP